MFDPIAWVEAELQPRDCDSTAFIYDHMESQSARGLPGLYVPFDPANRGHWRDAGSILDFLHAAQAAGGRVLDLGPGDGWPSLPVAPFAAEVVGVDGSAKRVEVCRENARRLGIANATFAHVPPGQPLPFADGTFDAVMAASSLEQTPDPRTVVRELARVLRPGGRLRIHLRGPFRLPRRTGAGGRAVGMGRRHDPHCSTGATPRWSRPLSTPLPST